MSKLTFLIQYNESCYGSGTRNMAEAAACAQAISWELAELYPEYDFDTRESDFCNEAKDGFKMDSAWYLSELDADQLSEIESGIKQCIESNWSDWINKHSEHINSEVFEAWKVDFELIFNEMVSDLKAEIFDWYKSEAAAHGIANPDLYAQNWLQGFDHGVRIDYSDRIDDKIKQEYGFSGDFVVLSGFGENDFLYSDSSESEIREFISQWLQFEYPEIEVA